MKKIKKIIISSLLFVAATTSTIGIIGLTSCSGATVEPPIEPPKPPIITPPVVIEEKVHLIVPGLAGESAWAWLLVKDVEYVKLIEVDYATSPGEKALKYIFKFKKEIEERYLLIWDKTGEKYKPLIAAYNNWLKASNDK